MLDQNIHGFLIYQHILNTWGITQAQSWSPLLQCNKICDAHYTHMRESQFPEVVLVDTENLGEQQQKSILKLVNYWSIKFPSFIIYSIYPSNIHYELLELTNSCVSWNHHDEIGLTALLHGHNINNKHKANYASWSPELIPINDSVCSSSQSEILTGRLLLHTKM